MNNLLVKGGARAGEGARVGTQEIVEEGVGVLLFLIKALGGLLPSSSLPLRGGFRQGLR